MQNMIRRMTTTEKNPTKNLYFVQDIASVGSIGHSIKDPTHVYSSPSEALKGYNPHLNNPFTPFRQEEVYLITIEVPSDTPFTTEGQKLTGEFKLVSGTPIRNDSLVRAKSDALSEVYKLAAKVGIIIPTQTPAQSNKKAGKASIPPPSEKSDEQTFCDKFCKFLNIEVLKEYDINHINALEEFIGSDFFSCERDQQIARMIELKENKLFYPLFKKNWQLAEMFLNKIIANTTIKEVYNGLEEKYEEIYDLNRMRRNLLTPEKRKTMSIEQQQLYVLEELSSDTSTHDFKKEKERNRWQNGHFRRKEDIFTHFNIDKKELFYSKIMNLLPQDIDRNSANLYLNKLVDSLPKHFFNLPQEEQFEKFFSLKDDERFLTKLKSHWPLACLFMNTITDGRIDLKAKIHHSALGAIYELNAFRNQLIQRLRRNIPIELQQQLVLQLLNQRKQKQKPIEVPQIERGNLTIVIQQLSDQQEIEIPKEMIDMFTGDIMKDPVKVIEMDDEGKEHIFYFERHLIEIEIEERGRNPYTKKPLSADMLQTATELKDEINKFKEAVQNGPLQKQVAQMLLELQHKDEANNEPDVRQGLRMSK
jgi:hypothetical protein